MAIWVGKQKMSCRSCIKGHRSSTCNHFGGPLWAVRPAGRPNKACIHGPGDLCLCAHYFPLTWLKAAVPRRQKCSCQGSGNGRSKCQCGGGNAAAAAASASTPEDDTQPIFYQDLVARGLQITAGPVDLDVPAAAPSSCCSGPAPAPPPAPASMVSTPMAGSCCSGGSQQSAPVAPIPVPALTPAATTTTTTTTSSSSCCGGGTKSESVEPSNGHIKSEPIATMAPFTPIQQFQPPPDFPVMKFSPHGNGAAAAATAPDHVCNCGPTCNCVLCIDHPYNNATMNHIATEFGQMMSNGGNGAQQQQQQQVSPGGGGDLNGHSRSSSRPDLSWQGWNGMMPPGFNDASFLNGQPQQSHSPPQQASEMDIILNPADFQMFNFAWPPADEDDLQQQFVGGAGQGLDMGMMDLNGFCGGAPEGCPCGDECACIGCQIHKPTNGHGNGVASPAWGSAL